MLGNYTSKYISVNALIAEVYRRFKISHANWESDAIESIGRALEIIGRTSVYEDKDIEVCIKDYKGKLPCSADYIKGFSRGGSRLLSTDIIGGTGNLKSIENYYSINPKYINVNFEKGIIIVHARSLLTDSNGAPLVPDAPFHKEAMGWRILYDLLLGGYKHPIIDFIKAEQMWELYYPKAQNEGLFPSIDTVEKSMRLWTSWVRDTKAWYTFGNSDRGSARITDGVAVIEPSDNERTIIHIDNTVSGGDLELGEEL